MITLASMCKYDENRLYLPCQKKIPPTDFPAGELPFVFHKFINLYVLNRNNYLLTTTLRMKVRRLMLSPVNVAQQLKCFGSEIVGIKGSELGSLCLHP